MIDRCPGTAGIRTPTISIRKCPDCGAEVELFSTDRKVDCPGCGRPVFNSITSCALYCEHAGQCLGREAYEKARGAKQKEV